MTNQRLYINGIFKATNANDSFALKMQSLAAEQLDSIPENLKKLPSIDFPLLPYNVLGIQKLRSLFHMEMVKQLAVNESGPER